MFKNYFTTALRNFSRQKTYSLINMLARIKIPTVPITLSPIS